MTDSTVRQRWLSKYSRIVADAEAQRQSQAASFELLSEYDSLTPIERAEIHPVLAEWLLSEDGGKRYDAAFIISQRRVRELVPAVRTAIEMCEAKSGPEAHFEAAKLRRLSDDLAD